MLNSSVSSCLSVYYLCVYLSGIFFVSLPDSNISL